MIPRDESAVHDTLRVSVDGANSISVPVRPDRGDFEWSGYGGCRRVRMRLSKNVVGLLNQPHIQCDHHHTARGVGRETLLSPFFMGVGGELDRIHWEKGDRMGGEETRFRWAEGKGFPVGEGMG